MLARIPLLVPLAVAAVLTACSGGDAKTDIYLKSLDAAGVSFSSDSAAISAGKKVCDDLKAGKAATDLSRGADPGGDLVRGASVVGAAIAAFCPDQQSKLIPG